jgi:hypothetical protein
MKISPVGTVLIHAEGHTGRMKLMGTFRGSCELISNEQIVSGTGSLPILR